MGREINVRAESHLSLQEAVTLAGTYQSILEAAFDERLAKVGGQAAMLDAVFAIAVEHGFTGTIHEADRLLRLAGFAVEIGPSGRPVVRRIGDVA